MKNLLNNKNLLEKESSAEGTIDPKGLAVFGYSRKQGHQRRKNEVLFQADGSRDFSGNNHEKRQRFLKKIKKNGLKGRF